MNDDSTNAHYTSGDYITLRNLKLERGDKATDWSAAPEDIAAEITKTQNDIADTAELASIALDAADYKNKVFTTQPTPPYSHGDIWVQGASGDIKVCYTSKASGGSYDVGDWVLASKYTDDTAVNNLQIGGRNLIWRTLKPGVDLGSRPCFNGLNGNTNGELYTGTGTLSVVEHGIKITNTDARQTVIRFGQSIGSVPDGNMLGLIAGETYTLSCDAEFKLLSGTTDSKSYQTQIKIRYAKPGDTTYTVGTLENGLAYGLHRYTTEDKGTVINKHVEFTFTLPSDITSIIFTLFNDDSVSEHYAAGDYIALRNLKLERGSKATDWSPAPEDISKEINDTALAMATVTVLSPTDNTLTLLPCPTTYNFGEKSELTVTVTADTEYHFMFSCPSGTPTVLTMNGITGRSGDTIVAGKTYEVDIWAGIALIKELEVTTV